MKLSKLVPGVLVSLILLAGCTTTEVAPPKVAQSKLVLLHQSNRYGTMEPCGCDVSPYGGIDREANAVSQIRKENANVLYVDSGNMFVPAKLKASKEQSIEKAGSLVEMLNRLGLDAYSPGANDYALGKEALKKLEVMSSFKFVSSNVVDNGGQNIFSPYVIVERGGVRYGILGVTPEKSLGDGITVENVDKSLSKWISMIEKRSDFIVVLSQLGSSEDAKLAVKHPEIRVIVGADPNLSSQDAFYLANGNTLLVDTLFNGNLLGRLNLEVLLPFKGFSNNQVIENNKRVLKMREAELVKQPSNQPLKKYIGDFKAASLFAPVEGGTTYSAELIKLDKERYGAKNELTQMIASEKERVRKRALGE